MVHTLKTGTPDEDGDPILKLPHGVSRPEIQLGVGIHSFNVDFQCMSFDRNLPHPFNDF